MPDYTPELVSNIIRYRELIEAFLERTTSELFPVYYELGLDPDFFQQENNTLLDNGPHNTRIPKRDSLKENLLVLKADVDRAMNQLSPEDKISVLWFYTMYEGKVKSRPAQLAQEAVDKMVEYLNGSST